jgi:parallel beta-helix repeat protein
VEIFGAEAKGNEVLGNFIGTNVGGAADLGNSGSGVFINAPGNFISATASGEGNTIAFNGQEAVVIAGVAATGNRILDNSIFSNGGQGIDLVGGTENSAGATQNDAKDPDTGPIPSRTSPCSTPPQPPAAQRSSRAVLTARPTGVITIQFFSNPSGNEGKTFIRERSVNTNSKGNTDTFSVTLASPSLWERP